MIVLGVRRDRIFGLADVGLFHSLLELFPYLPVLQVSLVLPLCALIFLVVLLSSLVASFHKVLRTNHFPFHPLGVTSSPSVGVTRPPSVVRTGGA